MITVQQTIYSAAQDACDLARRIGQDVPFTFAGTDAKARPDSLVADVVDVWFWKGQFEKWQKALLR